jgi:hypothetical protein
MIFTKEMRDKAKIAIEENKINKIKYQDDNKVTIGPVTIQPTIQRDGIGWELFLSGKSSPIWYLATKSLCEENIARYITRYNHY